MTSLEPPKGWNSLCFTSKVDTAYGILKRLEAQLRVRVSDQFESIFAAASVHFGMVVIRWQHYSGDAIAFDNL